jgi:hypothetical protein
MDPVDCGEESLGVESSRTMSTPEGLCPASRRVFLWLSVWTLLGDLLLLSS